MTSAQALAAWVRSNYPYKNQPLTHLKLQKLVFYCYGAALAFDCAEEVGEDVYFEAWDHGPVNREVWREYKVYGGNVILPYDDVPVRYDPTAEGHLRDALLVYGPLSAWCIRQESHLEDPWKQHKDNHSRIPTEKLRAHFKAKFAKGPVKYPNHLVNSSNSDLDRVPVYAHPTLRAVAKSVEKIFLA